MFEGLLHAGNGVHLLWGLGLVGLILRMMVNTYLNRLVKASLSMATTKKKFLKELRQKYENRKALGVMQLQKNAFVDKNVGRLRYLGVPIGVWRRSSTVCISVTVIAMTLAFSYYDVSWRGSPEMIYFLANGVMVCAFLFLVENIFLVKEKVDLLKANIIDYMQTGQEYRSMARSSGGLSGRERVEAASASTVGAVESAATESVAVSSAASEADVGDEEILNSFLKEFFT